MTDYQKLVDILMDEIPEDNPWRGKIKGLVEKLLANGVTVQEKVRDCHWATEQAYKNGYEQGKKDASAKDNNVPSKWIPVTERLPDCECLAISTKHGRSYNEQWIGWIYFDEITDEYICETDGVCLCGVTHWMPLPEPPKGEE